MLIIIALLSVALGGLFTQLKWASEELDFRNEQLNTTLLELNISKQTVAKMEVEKRGLLMEIEGKNGEILNLENELGKTIEHLGTAEKMLSIEESKIKVEDLREFGSIYELENWLDGNTISETRYIEDVYDCDDFAIDLERAARQEGYEIFIMADFGGYEYIDVGGYNGLLIAKDFGSYIDVGGMNKIENGNSYWYIDADELWETTAPTALYDLVGIDTLILYNSDEFFGHAFCIAHIGDYWYRIEPQTDEISLMGKEL